MSAPNYFSVVDECAQEHADLLLENSEQSILQFMQILGPRLRDEDANWGYLTKTPAEKHLVLPNGQFIAVDSFIYKATQQVVDVLTNAVEERGAAGAAWQEKEKRPQNDWYPISGDVQPPPVTHDCNCKEEIANLQGQIYSLTDELRELKEIAVKYGESIGLQSWGKPEAGIAGKVLCAENGGPVQDNKPFNITSRSGVGPWESFRVLRGQ